MSCWPQYILWFTLAVLGSGSMLSACGQKGDLYHPDKTENGQQKRKN